MSKARFLAALGVVALAVLVAQCAPILRGTLSCDGVQVLSNELTLPEAEAYCRYAVLERRKVEGFWGATWNAPIRIHVSSSYRISRALVPGYLGDRGSLEMPLRRARENTGGLLHEIVHIYAPHDNRFLAGASPSTCMRPWRAIRPSPTLERTSGVWLFGVCRE